MKKVEITPTGSCTKNTMVNVPEFLYSVIGYADILTFYVTKGEVLYTVVFVKIRQINKQKKMSPKVITVLRLMSKFDLWPDEGRSTKILKFLGLSVIFRDSSGDNFWTVPIQNSFQFSRYSPKPVGGGSLIRITNVWHIRCYLFKQNMIRVAVKWVNGLHPFGYFLEWAKANTIQVQKLLSF